MEIASFSFMTYVVKSLSTSEVVGEAEVLIRVALTDNCKHVIAQRYCTNTPK